MTSGAADSMMGRAARWPLSILKDIAGTYRHAIGLPVVAPAIFAIVVIPEFAQHVAEIQMGMFAPGDGISAGYETDVRMRFGAVKIAGLLIGILLTLRFWATGSLRAALRPGWSDAGRFLLAFAVLAMFDLLNLAAGGRFDPAVEIAIDALLWVPRILLLLWFIGAFVGDREMTVRRSVRLAIPNFLRAVILLPVAFFPIMALHQGLHVWADDKAPSMVWLLMVMDSLVVGFLATAVGSALWIFYNGAKAGAAPKG